MKYINNIFIFLILFLCLLKVHVATADSQKQGEAIADCEFDDAGLELLAQTLTTEKQRLTELEIEHKKLLDEIMAQPPNESGVGSRGSGVGTQGPLVQVPKIDSEGLKPEELKAGAGIPAEVGGGSLLTRPFNADLLETAEGLYKLLQYESALQIYQSIDPEKINEEDNAWVLYQTANCYKKLNQFDNALKTYQKLQSKYPNTYPAKEAHWYLENLNWWKRWYEKVKGLRNVEETAKLPFSRAEQK